MKADRIKLEDLMQPEGEHLLEKIAFAIKNGAVFIYPTETIYGIGGNTALSIVEEKIFKAKRRPQENPMIHLAAKQEVFSDLLSRASPVASFFADTFWPGLLTIVVETDDVKSGLAIRLSNHPFLIKLFDFVKFPIYSTSANVSGEMYNPDPDIIYETFKNDVDFMIDAGTLPPSAPSTVVKIENAISVKVLREGVLSKATIARALESAGFLIDLR
jgi:L-threonylcarbamoyladenylate synthase